MPFFRKKPVVIEARRFDQVTLEEQDRLAHWCGGKLCGIKLPAEEREIRIWTREGEMDATWGDWIIKGVAGEFYPCKPDIFAMTYDPAEEAK